MSETPVSPATKTGSQSRSAGDDELSQAMLRMGVTGVTPNVVEYWLEALERIMDDLDYTPEQKLKGVVSLLCDEAYRWWLTNKYVRASYVDARRCEFLNLTQGDRSVAEYKTGFLRLSCYA
ncbi:DNA/RNA polymerases superfamily protein [Gossypium australe]|uniref:DNA/RNA polymerases superfamily protein n=1 Tax=Gossypium australe TaxID=47621 RepID=A0A5B6X2T4_9ROSI|nr:DNA/RNA polymerases superfamily protein [Gossypium australe]